MINWNFNAEETEQSFDIIPEGKYRVRIDSAQPAVSRSGYDMVKLTLSVNGYSSKLFYYLVFMPDNTAITNSNLSRLWKSFDIEENNLDEQSWVGKTGAAAVKHKEYNGEARPQVSYFIDKSKQDDLEPWRDLSTDMLPLDVDDDLPF